MKYFNKTSLFVIVFALLFFILNEFFSYSIALKDEKNKTYEQNKIILNNLFDSQKQYLSSVAKILVSDSIVIKAYKENDPQILIKHITPMWQLLKQNKLVHEIHFFKPPAISFVNFSNFKSLGADVSDIRKDVVWVTNSFKESSHVFMCKTYAGYRSTEPIIDQNK